MFKKLKATKMGQVFLVNRDIAMNEAEHAYEKTVLEIGPGHGILTLELCKKAKKVIAVEKDKLLYDELKRNYNIENLELINADFLDLTEKDIDYNSIDIVISNIPYVISSKIIAWIVKHKKEAVLCLQKEFVEHMMAAPGTREYTKLSVFSSLALSISEIMVVDRGNFNPIPSIDSEIIYIRPKHGSNISEEEWMVINALMQHKKKTVRRAILDSESYLNLGKKTADMISKEESYSSKRIFAMDPEEILGLAKHIIAHQKTKGS